MKGSNAWLNHLRYWFFTLLSELLVVSHYFPSPSSYWLVVFRADSLTTGHPGQCALWCMLSCNSIWSRPNKERTCFWISNTGTMVPFMRVYNSLIIWTNIVNRVLFCSQCNSRKLLQEFLGFLLPILVAVSSATVEAISHPPTPPIILVDHLHVP